MKQTLAPSFTNQVALRPKDFCGALIANPLSKLRRGARGAHLNIMCLAFRGDITGQLHGLPQSSLRDGVSAKRPERS